MLLVAALVAVLTCLIALPASARTRTTHEQTIQDRDRDNQLEPAPGEDYLLRDNLGIKTNAADPVPRLFFAQFTDFHVIDEESPLRVEFLDAFDGPFTSAHRPHEGLMPQVVNEMIEQVRNTVSPVTHRQVELAMTTGDNTDNTQCNETRWMIDLMDGDKFINPDSGIEGDIPQPDPQDICNTQVQGQDPNPTYPPPVEPSPNPACDALQDNDSIYDGVRGDKQYYEPNSSSPRPTDPSNQNPESEDGRGYSPYEEENLAEEGRRSEVRDFPGLFERMNEPFRATGLQDLPWYGIFGNHDGLLQGNQPRNEAFEAYGVGCQKVEGTTDTSAPHPGEVLPDILEVLANGPQDLIGIIPPDARRRPLKKSEYIAEHFNTTGIPVGHGFTPANVASGMGYYSFKARDFEQPDAADVRFIVLDTIAENGGDTGNVDHTQFNWLHNELLQAENRGEVAMVFAHHSLETMTANELNPPFVPGDNGGMETPPTHQGFGPDGENEQCPTEPPANQLPPSAEESLHCLLLRHQSVVAFVNGHEHNNRITPFARRNQSPPPQEQRDQARGGFWEINTASHIDWPQQSRVIDIVDNLDGSLSLFTTIVDHSGPPMPGGAPPSSGRGQAADSPQRLASIARELSFNDPDSKTGEDDEPQQRGDARGNPDDRNTELIIRNPYGG